MNTWKLECTLPLLSHKPLCVIIKNNIQESDFGRFNVERASCDIHLKKMYEVIKAPAVQRRYKGRVFCFDLHWHAPTATVTGATARPRCCCSVSYAGIPWLLEGHLCSFLQTKWHQSFCIKLRHHSSSYQGYTVVHSSWEVLRLCRPLG